MFVWGGETAPFTFTNDGPWVYDIVSTLAPLALSPPLRSILHSSLSFPFLHSLFPTLSFPPLHELSFRTPHCPRLTLVEVNCFGTMRIRIEAEVNVSFVKLMPFLCHSESVAGPRGDWGPRGAHGPRGRQPRRPRRRLHLWRHLIPPHLPTTYPSV